MSLPARGFTLLEMLLVLALLGVVSVAGAQVLRPSSAQRAARAYLHTLQGVRIDAIAGRPGAVRWNPSEGAFVVRRGADPCAAPVRTRLAPPDRVAVTRWLRAGVVWRPDGTGRACDGGGVYGGRVRFEDRRGGWDVVVASTGRVRLEAVR